MTDRKLMQQALEALEEGYQTHTAEFKNAITALRERLAQPEQEPVALVKLMETGGNAGLATVIHEIDNPLRERLRPGDKLYTAPQPRQWQGLTDDEVENFLHALWPPEATPTDYIRALEAHLKKKNT